MYIDSKYDKAFVSDNITRSKYNELYNLAVAIRDHKNEVSSFVSKNFLKYIDYSRFSFIKEMREIFHGAIPSSYDVHIYRHIQDCYKILYDDMEKKMNFYDRKVIGYELYKTDTKNHRYGDIKNVIAQTTRTDLSNVLTYLTRCRNKEAYDIIISKPKKSDTDRTIIRLVDKFGFDRLYSLACMRRDRIIKKYTEIPIEFKTLTFSGRSRKEEMLCRNKNHHSIITTFIRLSGFSKKSFDIPVKYCRKYHGNIKEYLKPNPDYEYTMCFDEKHKQVIIHLCKYGKRYIPDAGENTIGIDVNCKHNLFTLSNGDMYEYDRKLVNDYCTLMLKIDELKKDPSYRIGKRTHYKIDTLRRKMKYSQYNLISSVCKKLTKDGVDHIVMEDLNGSFGKCFVKSADNDDINYARIIEFLRISSVKNKFEHIARKYGIAVSTVHSYYTSKMCHICGCIDDRNRKCQEEFKCVECGHTENADVNAAVNIKNRVDDAVLRNKLLKQLDNGSYEPVPIDKESIKKILLSFRATLLKRSVKA